MKEYKPLYLPYLLMTPSFQFFIYISNFYLNTRIPNFMIAAVLLSDVFEQTHLMPNSRDQTEIDPECMLLHCVVYGAEIVLI